MLQQGPPGFEENASPELLMLFGVIVLCLGFVLAFAGRIAWKHVMSFIGAVLGGVLGFVFGTAVGGYIVGIIVSMLGAVIGSAVFVFLSHVGLGVVSALLTYIVASVVVGDALVSLILAALAFAVTIAFIQQAIGVVTAVIGGLLVGLGLLWLDVTDMLVVVIVMFSTMVFGAGFQMSVLNQKKEVRTVAAAPVAPPMPGRMCAKCGGPLTYVPEYNRYYCHKCQKYD